MGSRPANPVPNPDESSLSHIKSQDMLADKVVDQWDDSDTENSSGSASYQIVPYKNVQGENNLPVLSKKRKFIISTYSVQCSTCQKWRVLPSKLKYEQIRENIIQVPFSCKYVHGWKPQVTCHDPTDIPEDNGMAWAIDIPCIPQTPLGYYISPAGIKIRSKKEVERYLEDNPDYAADLHLSQFSFKVPKPPNCPRQSELIEPTEVPPPVHEDPVHNYMPVPHGEANPVTHIPVTLALQVSVMLSKKRKLNQ
ncbi:Methyl-CpG-binding domain-containing protein 2 [Triticum urartu]|uniref:Methyl-CpG-binding domain-containing protein 2 n=1 Tax=Triticum urartu TaxID=4572 RepID=M7ZQ24_TRIUA|nr:Methyl-CpG-binding domain-containing protein 2 [Triticum urartu]